MKNTICALLFVIPFTSAFAMAIYNNDDRQLAEYASESEKPLLKGVAAQISKHILEDVDSETIKLKDIVSPHKLMINGEDPRHRPLCSDERFGNLLAPASCTGFLIGEDILLTAGHCVDDKFDCETFKWVFDFTADHENDQNRMIKRSNVYSCKKLLKSKQDYETRVDFAIVQLDRKVTDRTPLKLNTSKNIDDDAEVMLAGHPYGLPLIFSPSGYVTDKKSNESYFYASVDSFAGNSGSPVFNEETGLVEGILTKGQDDYYLDGEANCYRPSKYLQSEGRETVVKISAIYDEIKKFLK